MRRITQIRFTDWAVRILVTSTFFAYLLAPSRWALALGPVCFAAVGLWAILYPEGVLGWAKTAHREIDVNDSSIWWLPRMIGACFLLAALLLVLVFRN